MGRPLRTSLGGFVYHVLNRGNGRLPIFHKDLDYEACLATMAETQEHVPGMRLLAYCLMPNHWHLVLWPNADGELSDFMHWLTLTHTQRWHAHYQNIGGGHLYQGRFKSFPVETDEHFLTVCRYVERTALRAGLVKRAEDWRWGSLAQRRGVVSESAPTLSAGPLPWPRNWLEQVNRPLADRELEALRRCVDRGQPYGEVGWVQHAAGQLGLASTLRPRGRPKKVQKKGS
jgi:putative transposase